MILSDKEIKLIELEKRYDSMFNKYDLNKYPPYWFESNDIDLKIDVITKAIDSKRYIINVTGGSNFVEGVF